MAEAHTWYAVVKDLAAPFATLVAAAVAAGITWRFASVQTDIARTQAAIALDKLKIDLWEKRYEIYSAAKLLIEHIMHARSSYKIDPMSVRELYIKLDESRFFFPPEIQKYLQELHDVAEKLLTLVEQREILYKNDDAKWAASADEIGSYSQQLHTIYADLPKKFESTLAFEQITKAS